MKLTRPIVIPAILLIYLGVMAYLGFDDFKSGVTSPYLYFGTIGVTIVIIILLHFNLKRRARLRRERLEDIERQNKNKQ